MFQQLLTPVGDSLPKSFLVAALPVLTILLVLGALRRPAWQASLAGLVVGFVIAVGVRQFPLSLALAAVANGATFAIWPIMWIVFNALLLYNVAVKSGSFNHLRDWLVDQLPNDRRVVLIVIGFCFGALLEGIAGFGTPVAITASLLVLVGFLPLEALMCTLIFNTAPVAFAALGVPITVLAAVTHLPAPVLAAMVGRQLPVFALILPFYVTAMYAGMRSVAVLWPLLLTAGGTFALVQFVCSNFVNYPLTDVLSSLSALVATFLLLRRWEPVPDSRFTAHRNVPTQNEALVKSTWHAWAPWIVVSATVILWTMFAVSKIGEANIPWPGLHNAVSITLYRGVAYAAVWDFQPLGTGTAILVAAIITARVVKVRRAQFFDCALQTLQQTQFAILTVMLMLGLAYLMNYSGINYTLGFGVASVGVLFVLLSPFLGWVAVLISGSDTSANALFGNLQVIAARQLNLNPVLFAAANSGGGVMGKMVSPQNIATGASVTSLCGQEGMVFRRTFPHSIILTTALAAVVAFQQFVIPWIIPR
jgi:lactate permease